LLLVMIEYKRLMEWHTSMCEFCYAISAF